jgi:hypothetical protein
MKLAIIIAAVAAGFAFLYSKSASAAPAPANTGTGGPVAISESGSFSIPSFIHNPSNAAGGDPSMIRSLGAPDFRGGGIDWQSRSGGGTGIVGGAGGGGCKADAYDPWDFSGLPIRYSALRC